MRPASLLLLALTWCAVACLPAAAQRGAAYCNVTEITSEQLSNGVRVTIVCDGEVNWDLDFDRLVAEGALEFRQRPWGLDVMPSPRFTRIYLNLFNARSLLGSGFVPVGKYPVSHVEIAIPTWAREGVGLVIDVVNYLGWVTGEGDSAIFRYDLSIYPSDDRQRINLVWTSDRLPPPAAPKTPRALPMELSVTREADGLRVVAVNAPVRELVSAISQASGVSVAAPADSDLRVSLCLEGVSARSAIEAVACGCGLCARCDATGAWTLAARVDRAGGYDAATTRVVPLSHLRAREALDLLPNFLLDYLHADEERNAIVVTAPELMCERVAEDVAKLDTAPPEILVEAIAVEYTSETKLARALGLERAFGNLAAAAEALTGDLSFAWAPDLATRWSVALTALEQEQVGRLHSRATVRVINGRQGRVFAGTRRTIVIERIEEGLTAELEGVDVGTSLLVQPRVGRGDEVVMRVEVEVSDLTSTDPASGLPVLARRRATAYARVREGETMVVAGLHLDEGSRQVRALSPLDRAPVVGGLFRAPEHREAQTRLAVFLTPHILRPQVSDKGVSAHG